MYVALLVLSILISAYSQILLKKGSKEKNIYLNKYTIIGYGIMLIATVLSFIALKYVNLSLSQILQSLSFIFVAILSLLLLKERISKKKIIGMVIIIVGIIIFNI